MIFAFERNKFKIRNKFPFPVSSCTGFTGFRSAAWSLLFEHNTKPLNKRKENHFVIKSVYKVMGGQNGAVKATLHLLCNYWSLLCRALRNWSLQVHVVQDNRILGDDSADKGSLISKGTTAKLARYSEITSWWWPQNDLNVNTIAHRENKGHIAYVFWLFK